MLDNGNPLWDKKTTESEIIDEFNIYHIIPPIEQWYDEWTSFITNCKKVKAEREFRQQKFQEQLMKMRHLINLKQLKLEAFIKAIGLHSSIETEIIPRFNINNVDATKYGYYILAINIINTKTSFCIHYKIIDECLKKILEFVKRINDLAYNLQNNLAEYSDIYYLGESRLFSHCSPSHSHLYILKHSGTNDQVGEILNDIVSQINNVYQEFYTFLKDANQAKE